MAKQIDHDEPGRNLYGCLPCPKCGSDKRYPTSRHHKTHPNHIVCDDSGCDHVEKLKEPGTEQEGRA